MKGGSIAAEGPPSEVITTEVVREVFAIESEVLIDPFSGSPMIVPIGRHHGRPREEACAVLESVRR